MAARQRRLINQISPQSRESVQTSGTLLFTAPHQGIYEIFLLSGTRPRLHQLTLSRPRSSDLMRLMPSVPPPSVLAPQHPAHCNSPFLCRSTSSISRYSKLPARLLSLHLQPEEVLIASSRLTSRLAPFFLFSTSIGQFRMHSFVFCLDPIDVSPPYRHGITPLQCNLDCYPTASRRNALSHLP